MKAATTSIILLTAAKVNADSACYFKPNSKDPCKQQCCDQRKDCEWVASNFACEPAGGMPTPSPVEAPHPTFAVAPSPTFAVAPNPTAAVAPNPTPAPVEGQFDLCGAGGRLMPSATAGYTCLVGGTSTGEDSNFGGTEQDCASLQGDWTAYDCQAASSFYDSSTNEDHRALFKDAWGPKCCAEPMCSAGTVLMPSATAGYTCLVGGVIIEDSNFGATEQDCTSRQGDWREYDCQTAIDFYDSTHHEFLSDFKDAWGPQCCAGSSPTAPPVGNPTYPPAMNPTTPPALNPTTPPALNPTTPPALNPTTPPALNPTTPPALNPTTPPAMNPTKPPAVMPTYPYGDGSGAGVPVGSGVPPTDPPAANPTAPPAMNPTYPPAMNPTTPPAMNPTTPPATLPTAAAMGDPCMMKLEELNAVSCKEWFNAAYICADVWDKNICPGTDHPASKDKNKITVADMCPDYCGLA